MSAGAGRFRVLAPGKVNLSFYLGPRRPDGYHDVVSVLESVSLADELTLEPAPAGARADEVVCAGVPGVNLAARALAAFRAATGWDAPPQRLTIVKRVPVAAGMGGGSGDAAATLRLAARAAGLAPADPVLARVAPPLGADVPSQVEPGPVLATGAGERLLRLSPRAEHGVLVLPLPRPLPTPAVFAEADRLGLPRRPAALVALRDLVEGAYLPGDDVPRDLLHNDLEPAARSLRPEIDAALDAARAHGADRALVSGSGPTVLGFFLGLGGPAAAERAAAALAGRHPGAAAAVPVDAAFGAPRPLEGQPA